MSNFTTRLISGIVMVAILIALMIVGGDVLRCAIGVISIIGMFELYRVLKIEKSLLAIWGYICCVLLYLNMKFFVVQNTAIYLLFLIVLLAIYVFSYPKYDAPAIMGAFFGLFYVAVMLSYIVELRMSHRGQFLVWLIFLCSWGADTCAYCVGVLIGKHKMSPKLSPKKSIEGAVGGLVGSGILTAVFSYIFRHQMHIHTEHIIILVIIAVLAAFVSMIGDLAASAIKRHYDIKDYGHLIPGHGGILDRFDSVIITAPIIYFLCQNILPKL